jgi:hypothetical protein
METQVNLYLISYWVDGKSCRENQNSHFGSDTFFLAVVPVELITKNMVEPDKL